ncbi:MAG: response regulator transcription factor [Acidobacteriota bacterium]|nr:response regulator transcription factor [Acidobacteriota bacterium]
MSNDQKIRIAIATDNSAWQQPFCTQLSTTEEFAMAGTASSQDAALGLLARVHPSVLVIDLDMPDGFALLQHLDRTNAPIAALVVTSSSNRQDYAMAVRQGARGLVSKDAPPEYLFTAIRLVASGEMAFTDEVARSILQAMASGDEASQTQGMHRLSGRELEVAQLVASGMKNRDIGAQLLISENTVKRHLQSIFNKTGTRDRTELAVLALRANPTAA